MSAMIYIPLWKAMVEMNRFALHAIASFLLLSATLAGAASAASYYVSKSGNNTAAGTSPATAWLTIQKAADTAVGGDVVRVQPGTYAERVLAAKSGHAGQQITFVADGAVTLLGFNITGAYVRVIGFEITHATNVGYDGVAVGAAHVEILDCHIHNTSGTSISPRGAPYLVVRGNTMSYSGSPGNNSGVGAKAINDGNPPQSNVLIEYNTMGHNTDFLNSNGDYYVLRNNVLGPSLTTDFGGTPHVDGWQANNASRYGFMESNWHVDNSVSDSHMILIEKPVSGQSSHIAVIKNVSLRSGDQLWYQMRDGHHLYAAHNSVGQVGFGPRGGPASSGFFYVWDNSINNVARNNVYHQVTTGILYALNSGGQITHDHDLSLVGNDITHGVNGNIKLDPQFNNYAANDLTLKASSPAIDAGAALTTVTSPSGSGTTFTVANPDWFYDGFGLTEGQKIYVGNDNNLTVTKVDYTTSTISVSSAITWVQGEGVGYAYRGKAPDLGAYEFGDTLLSGALMNKAADTYTVVPSGDARFVVFYQAGIPHTTDFTAPYVATIPGGQVTAKVYALHAQANPVVTAVLASSSDGGVATKDQGPGTDQRGVRDGKAADRHTLDGGSVDRSDGARGDGGRGNAAGGCGCRVGGEMSEVPLLLGLVLLALGYRRLRGVRG